MGQFYNVVCLSGHVFPVYKGDELWEKAKAHNEKYVSALQVACRYCEECEVEDKRRTLYLGWND